jgi:glucosamine--fructose-6-phosphate aminotransferase (isomerizing)
MLVLVQLIAGYLGGHGDAYSLALLPDVCDRLLKQYGDAARQLGEDPNLERFFFLGSDALYGVACEAMLKLKEMSLSYSEAFHTLEFRHGPMSMVNEHTLMIGLLSESARTHELAVLRQMVDQGAQGLALGNLSAHFSDWATGVDLGRNIPDWGRPVLYLPVLQLMAYYRALARGHDPDHPTNLDAVVSLDDLR